MRNLKAIAVFLLSTLFSFECYAQIENINAVRKKAEAGNAQSQYLLGWAYGNGRNGVEQDYEEAFVWLSKSAEQGYEPAQYYLGWCYFYGNGVEKDPMLPKNGIKKRRIKETKKLWLWLNTLSVLDIGRLKRNGINLIPQLRLF